MASIPRIQGSFLVTQKIIISNLPELISDGHGAVVKIRSSFSEEDEVQEYWGHLSMNIDYRISDFILEVLADSKQF